MLECINPTACIPFFREKALAMNSAANFCARKSKKQAHSFLFSPFNTQALFCELAPLSSRQLQVVATYKPEVLSSPFLFYLRASPRCILTPLLLLQ